MNSKSLIFILLMLIALFGGFLLLSSGFNGDYYGQAGATPCSTPITYRIGEIDNRYQISDDELLDVMSEVASVWNSAVNGSVIAFDNEGQIAVNLVYADEQQLTDSERQFRDRINSRRLAINVAEREYEQMNARYRQASEELQRDADQLQNDLEELNSWVNQVNDQGGFTREELDRFEEQKNEIDRRSEEINRRGIQLQQMARELNQKTDQLNDEIDQKNILVNEYNRTFSGTQRFTQGTYEWTGEVKKISVYQFSDRNELRLVLAHEVGHALGIDHVNNPQSIMYHLMGSQNRENPELTSQDIRALREVCSM